MTLLAYSKALFHIVIMKRKQLPNIITVLRISAAPVLVVLLASVGEPYTYKAKLISVISALFFAAVMSTDMLDGYLARKYNWSSTFGKLIDPLADKLLFLSVMIMMIPLGWAPAWLVAVLFMREVMVTSLRGLAVEQGLVIHASHWGKYKQAFISAAIVGLLIHYPFFGIQWKLIGWALLWPAFILSVASGAHYAYEYFRQYGLR